MDEVDVGLAQLVYKALGKSRHRRQQPPLSLRVEGVKCQGRLPRSGDPRDDDELIARQFDRDIAEIVFPGALNQEGCSCRLVTH